VFDRLPPGLPRLVSVGRLDLNSEGLLLLTNDGGLARRLELPANGWIRRYRVRVYGAPDPARLAALANGLAIDDIRYGPIEAGLDSRKGDNAWISVGLREGRNREIRRVMAHLGLQVTRLIRVAYGPFQLGHLARAAVDEVSAKVLREQLPG
jgi:23S rRNA pseudouridine2605 synthase